MKLWPALDVHSADERVCVILDDFAPTALEEREDALRAFFPARQNRDLARSTLAEHGIAADPIDLPDDDWAVRSQSNLAPVTVGRITVKSASSRQLPASRTPIPCPRSPIPEPGKNITLIVPPSMGFGTGHHATTRLCLAALQTVRVAEAFVLDIGTGSGILAMAASRLGAALVRGLDNDPDAIQAARGNLALNPEVHDVQFEVADLTAAALPQADLITANLTGALLVRAAPLLLAALSPRGTLVVSGLLADEEAAVRRAFSMAQVHKRWQEQEWICLTFNPGPTRHV